MSDNMGFNSNFKSGIPKTLNVFKATSKPILAGAKGIEPSLTVLETVVLPLHHAPRLAGVDSNHRYRHTVLFCPLNYLPMLRPSLSIQGEALWHTPLFCLS